MLTQAFDGWQREVVVVVYISRLSEILTRALVRFPPSVIPARHGISQRQGVPRTQGHGRVNGHWNDTK
jgi:hypothetical protein